MAISKATASPVIVTRRASSLDSAGMVSVSVFVGRVVVDTISPAIMLPRARRVIELVRAGLFSFIVMRAGVRVGPICT